ncbi:SET methyltransferase domain containing protein [Nitzschia inconspicua]|uniref:SET methyltransferase domain containing protein n=1 Tax=Nitzschia inconspicua TaxID=303405 RepID=A0A9K3Q8U2_9STRA|nr:SET methyltransferase domain containing protein [Nitzschia inconspicua]
MFSLAQSFQRQGLVGLGAISSMMFSAEAEYLDANLKDNVADHDGDDDVSHDLTDLDSCVGEEEQHNVSKKNDIGCNMHQVKELVNEKPQQQHMDREIGFLDIPYERDNLEARNEYQNDGTEDHAKVRPVPYEDEKSYEDSFTNKDRSVSESGSHHFLFEIPYEDDNLKVSMEDSMNSVGKVFLNDIPFEYDTVTTSSESFTQGGDYTEVEEEGHELRHERDVMPIVEETDFDGDEVAVRTLFNSLGDEQEESVTESKGSNTCGKDYGSSTEDILAALLERLGETKVPTNHKNENEDVPLINDEDETSRVEDGEREEEEEEDEEEDVGWLPGFRVDVEVRPTSHLGENQYGIFALQNIPANTLVWDWTNRLQAYHCSEVESYIRNNFRDDDLEGIQTFLRRGFVLRAPSDNHFVSSMTDSIGFMNCSMSPNCRHQRATRDIHEGEELTLDYSFYGNPGWYVAICHKYGIMTSCEIAERQSKLGHNRFLSADYNIDDTDDSVLAKNLWLEKYISSIR